MSRFCTNNNKLVLLGKTIVVNGSNCLWKTCFWNQSPNFIILKWNLLWKPVVCLTANAFDGEIGEGHWLNLVPLLLPIPKPCSYKIEFVVKAWRLYNQLTWLRIQGGGLLSRYMLAFCFRSQNPHCFKVAFVVKGQRLIYQCTWTRSLGDYVPLFVTFCVQNQILIL